jgi:putative transposase
VPTENDLVATVYAFTSRLNGHAWQDAKQHVWSKQCKERIRMKLVEQHVIKRGDPRYRRIDSAAFASKNLWNASNYLVRQSFIFGGVYLNNIAVFHLIKEHEAYQALPRKVSNQVLLQLHRAWVGFFAAMEEWHEHPERFTGCPNLPGYKHKTEGRNLLVYEKGAIWKRELEQGVIAVSGL